MDATTLFWITTIFIVVFTLGVLLGMKIMMEIYKDAFERRDN